MKELFLKYRHKAKRLLQRFYIFLRKIKPLGLGGAGLYDVGRFFVKAMMQRRFTLAAMAMAFRFFFAIFPALILTFTLVPYFPIENGAEKTLELIGAVVPKDTMGFMQLVVDEFFNRPSAGVIYLNLGLLLFSALGGIKVMMYAFSKESDIFRHRNFFRFNFVALVIFLGLLLVFLLLIGILVFGEIGIHYLLSEGLVSDGATAFGLRMLFLLMIFGAVLLGISLLYYLGPATKERVRFFSPGSIATSVLILVAFNGLDYFFVNFTDYNKIYGSLGAIMVLMMWFYWISIVLLIGFELNAAVLTAKTDYRNKRTKLALPEEEEEEE